MSIFKKKVFDKCTIIANETLQRKDLSLAAKGLLSYMLSLPDNWDFTIAGLSSCTGESSYQVGKLLKELEDKGYHTKVQLHENGKIKDWIYYIFAEPQQDIINGTFKDKLKLQDVENQDVENNSLNKYISKDIYNNKTKSISKDIDNKNKEIYNEENKSKKEDLVLKQNIKCIIDYLNESIKSNYRYDNKQTIRDIKARLKEGYTLDNFYDVIDKKVKEWFNTDMQKYLRPITLFGNKFETYLNQQLFSGKVKSNYSSKPTFDNTANHNVGKAVADMTPEEYEYYCQHQLARDENGNYIKF